MWMCQRPRHRWVRATVRWLGCLLCIGTGFAHAQQVWIFPFPFENRTGATPYYWMGEAIVEWLMHNIVIEPYGRWVPFGVRRAIFAAHGLVYPYPVSLPTALSMVRAWPRVWIFHGYYTRTGSDRSHDTTLRWTLRLIDPSGRVPPTEWTVTLPMTAWDSRGRPLLESVVDHLKRNGIPARLRAHHWPDVPLDVFELWTKTLWTIDPGERWQKLHRIALRAPDFVDVRWTQIWTAMQANLVQGPIAQELTEWVDRTVARRTHVDAQAANFLATWFYLRQRWDRALDILIAARRRTDHPGLENNIGVILARLGRIGPARGYLAAAPALDPRRAVHTWNGLVLARMTEDWPFLREWIPQLYPRTFHPVLITWAADTARRFADTTSARWLTVWAESRGASSTDPTLHDLWIWITWLATVEGPWDPLVLEGVRSVSFGNEPSSRSGTSPVWIGDLNGLWTQLDAKFAETADETSTEELEAWLRALTWLMDAPELQYYRALLMARRGDTEHARTLMQRYYQQTSDPRARRWLEQQESGAENDKRGKSGTK